MLLVISQNYRVAKSVANTFYYMSILSYATTPNESISEISSLYRSVLIIDPKTITDIREYVGKLRSYNNNIPIFALLETPTDEYKFVFEECYTPDILTPTLAKNMINYANNNQFEGIGHYSVGGFSTSCEDVKVRYFDRLLKLTRTEAMILRYLMRSYPTPKSACDILKYAYKSDTAPHITTIKTHISKMNNGFRAAFGINLLKFVANKGYVLATPEVKINFRDK